MKVNFKIVIYLSVSISFCAIVNAQAKSKPSEPVGQELKNSLSIGDILPATVLKSLPQKKGTQLYILDFWSTWCSSCMSAFPKMEKLQKQFKDDLQVVLVNSNETKNKVQQRLNEINDRKRNKGLELIRMPDIPAIYNDTALNQLFPHLSVPHHVWLNNKGKVLAITSGYNATPTHVSKILQGEKLSFSFKDDLIGYDLRLEGWLKPGHPSLPPPKYSMSFMRHFEGFGSGYSRFEDSVAGIIRTTYRNESVINLFKSAYYSFSQQKRVIIESRRKKDWIRPDDMDRLDTWNMENLFSYEITLPLKEKEKVWEYLRHDANRYFGALLNIEARWEKRKLKAIILVKTENGLLGTTGEKQKYSFDKGSHQLQNYPFNYLVSLMTNELENLDNQIVFVDETGINGNVDIKLFGDLKDVAQLQNQLRKYGLAIIQGERELEVLVIADKN